VTGQRQTSFSRSNVTGNTEQDKTGYKQIWHGVILTWGETIREFMFCREAGL